MPLHGTTDFADDFPDDLEYKCDWCEERLPDGRVCGNRKRKTAKMCNDCRSRTRTEERIKEEDAKLDAVRVPAHQFYQEKRAQGWTVEQIIQHINEEREKRGDPIRPRFWSSWSISE